MYQGVGPYSAGAAHRAAATTAPAMQTHAPAGNARMPPPPPRRPWPMDREDRAAEIGRRRVYTFG
ncbi:hypothetical protein GCM10020367_42750 [Streptomyces sannanensis]|uniref:Uncharacterized protein n=1 Tax=Streptomyces sannanensis TaxID=285536 RepID=A0ABP6SFW4_9ACTN